MPPDEAVANATPRPHERSTARGPCLRWAGDRVLPGAARRERPSRRAVSCATGSARACAAAKPEGQGEAVQAPADRGDNPAFRSVTPNPGRTTAARAVKRRTASTCVSRAAGAGGPGRARRGRGPGRGPRRRRRAARGGGQHAHARAGPEQGFARRAQAATTCSQLSRSSRRRRPSAPASVASRGRPGRPATLGDGARPHEGPGAGPRTTSTAPAGGLDSGAEEVRRARRGAGAAGVAVSLRNAREFGRDPLAFYSRLTFAGGRYRDLARFELFGEHLLVNDPEAAGRVLTTPPEAGEFSKEGLRYFRVLRRVLRRCLFTSEGEFHLRQGRRLRRRLRPVFQRGPVEELAAGMAEAIGAPSPPGRRGSRGTGPTPECRAGIPLGRTSLAWWLAPCGPLGRDPTEVPAQRRWPRGLPTQTARPVPTQRTQPLAGLLRTVWPAAPAAPAQRRFSLRGRGGGKGRRRSGGDGRPLIRDGGGRGSGGPTAGAPSRRKSS